MRQEHVRRWMTPNPVTIEAKAGLTEAHELLQEHNIRRLLVVDKKDNLIGVVTQGDIREASPSDATSLTIWELNYLWAKLTVDEIMTPDPITVYTSDTLAEVANIMLEHKVSGLPVVEPNGQVVGIITESDIFRLVVQKWEDVDQEDEREMALAK